MDRLQFVRGTDVPMFVPRLGIAFTFLSITFEAYKLSIDPRPLYML